MFAKQKRSRKCDYKPQIDVEHMLRMIDQKSIDNSDSRSGPEESRVV